MQSKFMKATTNYECDIDILDINILDDYDYKTSLELETGIMLDFDINNLPVSLEILDASKVFKVKKDLFSNIKKVDMLIEVTEELIRVEVELEFNIPSKISSLKSMVLNTIKAPVLQAELATS